MLPSQRESPSVELSIRLNIPEHVIYNQAVEKHHGPGTEHIAKELFSDRMFSDPPSFVVKFARQVLNGDIGITVKDGVTILFA